MSDRFQGFRAAFIGPSADGAPNAEVPDNPLIADVPGFLELMANCAGKVQKRGAYRLLDQAMFTIAVEFVDMAFPAWKGRLAPFGCDWMGRIFAVDGSGRTGSGGERCVSLLDPATRDLLQVPATVTEFHNVILVEEGDLAYEETLWAAWLSEHPRGLDYTDVAGWRIPAFLGGELTVDNLEIQSVSVYWGISGQLIAKTFKLEPGQRIVGVEID